MLLVNIVKKKFTNKTKIPQVIFDAYGNPINVPPGKTVEYAERVVRKVEDSASSNVKKKANGDSK